MNDLHYYYHDGDGWRLVEWLAYVGCSSLVRDVYRGSYLFVALDSLCKIRPRSEWDV